MRIKSIPLMIARKGSEHSKRRNLRDTTAINAVIPKFIMFTVYALPIPFEKVKCKKGVEETFQPNL